MKSKNYCNLIGDLGVGRSCRASILARLGHMPFCGEKYTIEGDLMLSDPIIRAVEDNAMLGCYLHKLQEVSVMFVRSVALDAYIIVNGDNAGEVHYVVHMHLKDILGHLQAKRHVQELVPAIMCVKMVR